MLQSVDMIGKWAVDRSNTGKTLKCDVVGLLLHVHNIKLVGWKEEEIVSISNGKNVLLDVSFWKTHDEPKGLNFGNADQHKGRLVVIKNVEITHEIDQREDRLQMFGNIQNGQFQRRHIIMLHMNDCDINDFEFDGKPFRIDVRHSVIPHYVKGKSAGEYFPLILRESKIVKQVITHHKWYNKCIRNGSTKIMTYLTLTLARRGFLKLETKSSAESITDDITNALAQLKM